MDQMMSTNVYKKIDDSANEIFEVLSQFIGVNTFCVTKLEETTSQITSVFNRDEILIEKGNSLILEHAY